MIQLKDGMDVSGLKLRGTKEKILSVRHKFGDKFIIEYMYEDGYIEKRLVNINGRIDTKRTYNWDVVSKLKLKAGMDVTGLSFRRASIGKILRITSQEENPMRAFFGINKDDNTIMLDIHYYDEVEKCEGRIGVTEEGEYIKGDIHNFDIIEKDW